MGNRGIVIGIVGVVALVAAYVVFGAATPPSVFVRVEPAASLPRIQWQRVESSGLGVVSDFALASGRLFLLDPVALRVVVLEEQPNGSWRETTSFGKKGGGPGEFLDPTSITAVATGGIVVSERQGRMQYFTEAGEYVRSAQPRLPCTMSSAQIASAADSTLFLAGNCLGTTRDTMFAVLSWSRDGQEFTELVREPKMAVDGSWGTIYVPRRPMSAGTRKTLFGVGISGCVVVVSIGNGDPVVSPQCDVATAAIEASPPPGFSRQLRDSRERGRSLGAAYDWPVPLPIYFDKVATTRGIVLLRPYHADSLFLELARSPGSSLDRSSVRPILVGSLHHFVGCGRDGCLWYDAEAEGARLSFLTIEALETILAGQSGSPKRSTANGE